MNEKQQTKRAIIYCRVSTKEQVDEGNSLSTQEKICKEYAIKHGYEVAELFIEEGESAKTAERTQLKLLLTYCSNKKNEISAVIAYKIDRISRNFDDYSQIRVLLKRYGVEIKSTSENFENNTPAGRFMENIIANVAQFDNDVRTERSVNGMKEAMREGRYVWYAPVGYKNIRINGKTNIIQTEMAPLIKRSFELISKRENVDDVRRTVTTEGLTIKTGKPLSQPYFYKVVRNRIYAGYITKFGETHRGTFEPIVSEELFDQVQRVIKNRGWKQIAYKKDNPDFPLRRFVKHPKGGKLTGSWSRSQTGKKYAFYRYPFRGKNYPKDGLENIFMQYMDSFSFEKDAIAKIRKFVGAAYQKAVERGQKTKKGCQLRIDELIARQANLIDKNAEGIINDTLLKRHLDTIEKEIDSLKTKVFETDADFGDVKEALEFAETYLLKPSSAWEKALLRNKVRLQWFQFPSGITFDGEKFGTEETSLIFKDKNVFLEQISSKVPLSIEFWNSFVRECSILMDLLTE